MISFAMVEMRTNFCLATSQFRYMRILTLLLLSLMIPSSLFSTETIVQGNIQNFDEKTIKGLLASDYITFTFEEVAKSKIRETTFKLTFDLEETQQLFLKIEDKQTSLFVNPGEVYNLSLSYDVEANQGRAFDKYLDLHFSFPKAGETNQLIKTFNKAYQDFFSKNYQRFLINAAQKEIDAFVLEWEAKESYQKDAFVANYVRYSLANLKDINRSNSKEELFNQYLKEQVILYSHKEYMNFFKQLYHLNFEQFALTKNGAQVLKALMIEEDLNKTLELIQKYKGIDQSELAELYLIYGLFEVYHKKTIQQEVNLKILQEISEKGKSPFNRKIAANAIVALKRFSNNDPPPFTLNNEKGAAISLADFKGKAVYLGFWADWSIPSLRELKVLKNLQAKYGDKIHFVSINLDDDSSKMSAIKAENKYNWTFLHYGKDYEIREKYQVKTVPSYFLIDERGKMIQAHAQGPTEIERKLYDLTK